MEKIGAFLWNIKKIVSKGDYDYAVVCDHPKRTKNNYVLLHRVIMENHLGRLLNSDEVVHHKNGIKKDNRLENLELFTNKEHVSLHSTKGITMVELRCPNCNTIFIRERRNTHLTISRKAKYTTCSSRCKGQFSRKIQLHGLTQEMKSAISVNTLREFNSLDNTEGTVLQRTP